MEGETIILTRDQVRTVDALAISELAFPSIVLMENAGKNCADWILTRFDDFRAVVFCGVGNNGGDGFVIARHLHNHGINVRIFVVGDLTKLTPDAKTNYTVSSAMKLPYTVLSSVAEINNACESLRTQDIVVDALLGTGFSGSVREPMSCAIQAINNVRLKAVVAVDVPSGLDCDSGKVGNVVVKADATVTFVAAKRGFELEQGPDYVGEVVVVDIGTPPSLTRKVAAL